MNTHISYPLYLSHQLVCAMLPSVSVCIIYNMCLDFFSFLFLPKSFESMVQTTRYFMPKHFSVDAIKKMIDLAPSAL